MSFNVYILKFLKNSLNNHKGCPVDVDDKSKRWCSTKVDSHGNHIAKQHQYGHCGNNCPVQNSNSHGSGNSGNNGHGGGNSGNCPSGQTCKSFAQCASQDTSGNVQTCTLFSDGLGICCKDITGNSGMYIYFFFSKKIVYLKPIFFKHTLNSTQVVSNSWN